jgi:hypothetical protein
MCSSIHIVAMFRQKSLVCLYSLVLLVSGPVHASDFLLLTDANEQTSHECSGEEAQTQHIRHKSTRSHLSKGENRSKKSLG